MPMFDMNLVLFCLNSISGEKQLCNAIVTLVFIKYYYKYEANKKSY